MPPPKNFHFTAHARQRGTERKISKELFAEVVLSPDRKTQQYKGEHGGFVTHFIKRIDGSEVNIFAEIHKEDCYFVTGYWT